MSGSRREKYSEARNSSSVIPTKSMSWTLARLENSGLVELVKIRYTRMKAPMTNATAMPKKIGSREKPFAFAADFAFALRTPLPLPFPPAVGAPARRACWVLMPDLVPPTTLLMVLLGESWVLYSYSNRMLGFCLKARMASSISAAL